jgi:glutaredoxin
MYTNSGDSKKENMLTVYGKANCPFCDQTKALLKSKDIPFTEVRIDEDATAKDFIIAEGHRTVPQIYKDGQLFVQGGFTGLRKLTETELKAKAL